MSSPKKPRPLAKVASSRRLTPPVPDVTPLLGDVRLETLLIYPGDLGHKFRYLNGLDDATNRFVDPNHIRKLGENWPSVSGTIGILLSAYDEERQMKFHYILDAHHRIAAANDPTIVLRPQGQPVKFTCRVFDSEDQIPDIPTPGFSGSKIARFIYQNDKGRKPYTVTASLLLNSKTSPWYVQASKSTRLAVSNDSAEDPKLLDITFDSGKSKLTWESVVKAFLSYKHMTDPVSGVGFPERKRANPVEVQAAWQHTPIKEVMWFLEVISWWNGIVKGLEAETKAKYPVLYSTPILALVAVLYGENGASSKSKLLDPLVITQDLVARSGQILGLKASMPEAALAAGFMRVLNAGKKNRRMLFGDAYFRH